MPEQSYFQNALSNFTYEAASGGAIRHLTDLGYTAKQIVEQLDFPTPFARVQKEVWQRLIDTNVILLKEPGSAKSQKETYVREYDKYGRASFRKVVEQDERNEDKIFWRKQNLCGKTHNAVSELIRAKIAENGDNFSYVACDFGLLSKREPERFERILQKLDTELREYIEGLPWERQRVYHRLDGRMTKIWLLLKENEGCFGESFFLKTKEIFTDKS